MTILIVGFGSIAAKHVKALRTLQPSSEFIALRSSNDATNHDGIHNIYAWSEVTQKPDFILISNPTRNHKEAILESISIDCPLFIEKPVLADVTDAIEIIPLLETAGILTYTGCNLRFHPCILFLRTYLKEKKTTINEVNIYCGSDLSMWRTGQDYRKSYSADASLGGGVHLDLIHELDYCCWLFGFPSDSFGLRRKVSSLEIDSVDFAAFHLIYPDFTANIVLNYYRKDARRSIEIVFEDGTLCADLITCDVSWNGRSIFSKTDFGMEETYLQQMEYFINHISEQRKMMNDFFEALEMLKIATK
jgi:predicted dehydrogenase